MPLPGIRQELVDGALGLEASATDAHVKVGVSSLGTPNRVYAFTDPNTLRATLGTGPLVEACAYHLGTAKRPVLCVPVAATTPGELGDIIQTGTSPAITDEDSEPLDGYELAIKVDRSGRLGEARFVYSLDGGKSWSPAVATPAPGLDGWSTVTKEGAGPDVTVTGTPAAPYLAFRVEITTAGARGVAKFRWSSDGGETWTTGVETAATVDLGATGATVGFENGSYAATHAYSFAPKLKASSLALPGTGIALEFATGDYLAGDAYSATCTPPSFDSGSAFDAIEAALADGRAFRLVHLIGAPASAEALASLAMGAQAAMDEAEAEFRYIYTVLEAPEVPDEDLRVAFANVVAPRVYVAAGHQGLVSFVEKGRVYKRPAAWPFVSRVMSRPIHEHPGRFATGPLAGVAEIYRDERTTPGLDDARFVTLRTFVDEPGFFITRGKSMAAPGSDFDRVQRRQVIDRALQVAYKAMLRYVNESLVTNPNGTIDDAEAASMEATVLGKLEEALLGVNNHASAVLFQIMRTNNVLTTDTIRYKVRVRPLGYAEFIEGEVGFAAPSTEAA